MAIQLKEILSQTKMLDTKSEERASRDAEDKLHLLQFNLLQSSRVAAEEPNTRLVNLAVAKFDIWAERGVRVVWDDAAVRGYDKWL